MAKYNSYHINLNNSQRTTLEKVVSSGKSGAREIRRANVLLLADESDGRKRTKDVDIAKALGISVQAIHDIKKQYLERKDGPKLKGIERKKRTAPPVPAKFTGETEARITAIACSAPPEGRSRWNLRLISERAVELEIVDSISHMQVSRILKKTGLSLT